MGIKTKIKSLGVPQTKILKFSFSTILQNGRNTYSSQSQLFTGNMWNLNQMSLLNKMIPLTEVLGGGGGCMGGYSSPWTILFYAHTNISPGMPVWHSTDSDSGRVSKHK